MERLLGEKRGPQPSPESRSQEQKSHVRKSKEALFMSNRYSAARQMKRARKKIKEVKNYLGRVIRNIEAAD